MKTKFEKAVGVAAVAAQVTAWGVAGVYLAHAAEAMSWTHLEWESFRLWSVFVVWGGVSLALIVAEENDDDN